MKSVKDTRCIDLVCCAGYCRLARYRFESYLDQMGIDLEERILDFACGQRSARDVTPFID